ncbi:glycosyltransferase family 2 protein [Bradyrhizobium sp. CNPSo 4010]|uniref:Glycosyltransferase family 2 protein n=1 Tax=Bradyrhizobium agreste TaxID=2751811 RepID=A0ABS0PRX2_9BRAD|nr:glycosyltransferase family 2 protein [Bradyrhizobium agreste]MBH5399927.1 glycosyltransferase family 2 protein [Bradyrhizobium agreste]
MNVIVTLIRDEQDILEDFVAHHLRMNFDKIIIFDDQSEVKVAKLVEGLPKRLSNRVEVHEIDFDFYRSEKPPAELYDAELYGRMNASKQIYFLNYAIKHLVDPDSWVAFIDADEFIWLPVGDVATLRAEIAANGYCGIILDWLNYGHAFNISPPLHNNVASYIWRASTVHGEGKYFGSIRDLYELSSPHFPQVQPSRQVCDAFYDVRSDLFSARQWTADEIRARPHLKHFMVRDIETFFRKKARGRIATSQSVESDSPYWSDRIRQISISNEIVDPEFAEAIIQDRLAAGLPTDQHQRALDQAKISMANSAHFAAFLDFDWIRKEMPEYKNLSDSSIILTLLRENKLDASVLRFARVPDDFEPETYRKLNKDLEKLNAQQLRNHFAKHGRGEKRTYRDPESP